MKIELTKKLTGILALFLAINLCAFGQTREEAVETYNSALDLIDDDIKAAIEKMEKALEMAEELGQEGMEVKEMVEVQLPGLYYDMSIDMYRGDDMDGAIEGFERAIELAEEYGDPDTKKESENVLHQLYFRKGNNLFREEQNEEALDYFDRSLEINPEFARAHLGKGLVFRRLQDTDNFREAINSAIEYGNQAGDQDLVSTANRTARDYFVAHGARARSDDNFDRALSLLEESVEYDSNFPEAYHLMASIHNEQENWTQAVENAERAIEASDESAEEKARYYFELGKAYMELGNESAACSAFENAAYGDYEESANYHIDHVLNCP